MSDSVPFEEDGICPQCGINGATFRFCSGETAKCLAAFRDNSFLRTNHFHRQCRRCSFTWLEESLAIGDVAPVCDECGLSEWGNITLQFVDKNVVLCLGCFDDVVEQDEVAVSQRFVKEGTSSDAGESVTGGDPPIPTRT